MLAEIVGRTGRVIAFEVEPDLATRARTNLGLYSHVDVITSDACDFAEAGLNVIMVNAGVTHPQRRWLDALADEGRLLLPLTFEPAPALPGKGIVLLIARHGARYTARFLGMVAIYSCTGSRDPALNARIRDNMVRGTWGTVRSLRIDPHDADHTCWLHGAGWCLSQKDLTPDA